MYVTRCISRKISRSYKKTAGDNKTYVTIECHLRLLYMFNERFKDIFSIRFFTNNETFSLCLLLYPSLSPSLFSQSFLILQLILYTSSFTLLLIEPIRLLPIKCTIVFHSFPFVFSFLLSH